MEAKKSLKAVAACALSVAMLFAGAACGTSDGSDDAASSDSGSKASELTGYDVSSVQKDDDIAKLLPDYVTKDASSPSAWTRRTLPPNPCGGRQDPGRFDVDIAKALANMFGLEVVPQTRISIRSFRRSAPSTISAFRRSPSRPSVWKPSIS